MRVAAAAGKYFNANDVPRRSDGRWRPVRMLECRDAA